jgi:hypothetical protein
LKTSPIVALKIVSGLSSKRSTCSPWMYEMALEKSLETKIVNLCKSRRIPCLKLKLATGRGWADRTIFRNGKALFLEIKREDGTGEESPQQAYWRKILLANGFEAHVVDSFEQARKLIEEMG